MSKQKTIGGWALIVITLGMVGFAIYSTMNTRINGQPRLHIGNGSFQIKLADSEAEREQGLSGLESMPENQALVMVFEHDQKWPIWMKDMNFPIDVIWLDQGKKVVDMREDVGIETYPENIRPKFPARYIVEVHAGMAHKHNVNLGTVAYFEETIKP